MPVSITEALAERKTLEKRLAKKRAFVKQYLVRQKIVVDPLADADGRTSAKAIRAELQSIDDLEQRIVKIRSVINAENRVTTLTIHGATRSVAEWLWWRREVAGGRKAFLLGLLDHIRMARAEASKHASAPGTEAGRYDLVVEYDEGALHKEAEDLDMILGALDGQLSLLNARTAVHLDD